MKSVNITLLCLLLYFGLASSQEPLSPDSLPKDSLLKDSLLKDSLPQDSLLKDSLLKDSLLKDSLIVMQEADVDSADADSIKIKPGLHFFASVGAQFINFKDRSKFQTLLDEKIAEIQTESGLLQQKQDFQNVNLAFPIMAGIMWQFSDLHSIGLAAGFMYDNESVILTGKDEEAYNLRYTLQAFPLFVEYRLLVPSDLISLKNGDYFSMFLRYYWMLPGTEIYSSWGEAKADFDPLGSGFGVFFGYRFWEWNFLSIWGELGYLSLDVKSDDKNGVLNSWNLGGISLLVRAMF